ncbi:PqiB family protein [Nitratifractor sp.]
MPESSAHPSHEGSEQVKEAVWSRKRRFSTVWIVPIVALVIGAVLIYQSLSQRGPTIEITFRSAAGITAGKSVVKYKDVEVGKVKDVRFNDDLKSVVVVVQLKKEMKPFLTDKTRFWVVHARLSADSVEGLDTLLSGAYIGMDPHRKGTPTLKFKGLENPPVLTDRLQGIKLVLEADERGSLQQGSPLYYKKLKAGTVIGTRLSPDAHKVLIEVFVNKPFDKLITDTTRFWDASGIDATIGPDGVEIRTASLTAILSGGISFDNFEVFGPGHHVRPGHHFVLFPNLKMAKKITYKRELYFWVYFQDSIRGLKEGAPVEFRGVKIGEVVNFFLVGDAKTAEFKIPILIKIEPERFTIRGQESNATQGVDERIFTNLIAKGFRAQLQSSSLITGDLLIDLNFYPDAKPVKIRKENGLYVIPSVPATLETLKSNLKSILDEVASIPFRKIGEEVDQILTKINEQAMPSLDRSMQQIDRDLLPSFKKLLDNSNQSLEEIQRNYLDSNALIQKKILLLLDELTRTSRSFKNLTDYLQRHPESIIRGK